MKLLYFYKDASLHLGVATEKGVADITATQQLKGKKDFSTGNISRDDLGLIHAIAEEAIEFLPEESIRIATCTPFANKLFVLV